ncbi:patatin-like protein [Streptomyces sp. NPDC008001]|uniref:patatin-like protein n=1 Tax=Streptomyces sp. NPDC008001 TaxID=3364804 RepID=UPI0036E129DC
MEQHPLVTSRDTDFDRQDIRLAVVMNGGVSLAVWIGGVTLELHHLAMARRWDETTYKPLLDLLHADARVDVIAGTSAGGLNGAFLALGLARGRDIASVCDLWRDKGSLGALLRDPLEKAPPSLLKGDDYFQPAVREALRGILTSAPPPGRAEEGAERPVELILTGTLWGGRRTSFSDDTGVRITEVDHDARFRFGARVAGTTAGGDLTGDQVIDELAAAARCSSSFPAAFEPHWVEVTSDDGREGDNGRFGDRFWTSTAGPANFQASQYVVDGGVLLNKPIRPALEAVYRQTAELQVRRVLTYVVPDPGEEEPPPGDEGPPDAPGVLLGVLTRLRSTDSVSRELAEIGRRNEESRMRRRGRDRFAAAMSRAAEPLSEAGWEAYIDVRVDTAARTIGHLIATGQNTEGPGRWSERELVDQLCPVLREGRNRPDSFIPRSAKLADAMNRPDEDWDWGQTTVRRLQDMTLDVLKRAVWLAPMGSAQRARIVEARGSLRPVCEGIQADWDALEKYWLTAPVQSRIPMPARKEDAPGTADQRSIQSLRAWLRDVLKDRNAAEAADGGLDARRQRQSGQAMQLASCLHDCAEALRDIVRAENPALDQGNAERERLEALTGYLVAETPKTTLQHMLRLDVVQLAYSGSRRDVEQEVELLQFSSRNPDLLTGRQLHHFGAFYRPSWRINDWIHGRMDGAAHIVRMLMSTERLRQIASHRDDEAATAAGIAGLIRACAVSAADSTDGEWLAKRWDQGCAEACLGFVTDHVVGGGAADPLSAQTDPRLHRCLEAVTYGLQTHILRQDLGRLADAVRGEGADRPRASTAWLKDYESANTGTDPLPPADLWKLWQGAKKIGTQRIREEVGGDLLADTAARTAAVAVSAFASFKRPKVVTTILGALHGYTLAVWAMVAFLTRPGRFGNRLVQLAVATGGVLLATSLLVPGLPPFFTLAGVLVLLAGWSAAALLSRRAWHVGLKLAIALAVTVGAFVLLYVGGGVEAPSEADAWRLLAKAGVGLLVVLMGWWIAWTPRRKEQPSRPGGD